MIDARRAKEIEDKSENCGEYSWAIQKNKEEIGWSAKTDIDNGLKKMIKRLEENDNE